MKDGQIIGSQSSLKRVLVSEPRRPATRRRTQAEVAILFEASPGFGGRCAAPREHLCYESQSSLKRVLVSEMLGTRR